MPNRLVRSNSAKLQNLSAILVEITSHEWLTAIDLLKSYAFLYQMKSRFVWTWLNHMLWCYYKIRFSCSSQIKQARTYCLHRKERQKQLEFTHFWHDYLLDGFINKLFIVVFEKYIVLFSHLCNHVVSTRMPAVRWYQRVNNLEFRT